MKKKVLREYLKKRGLKPVEEVKVEKSVKLKKKAKKGE